MLVMKLFNLYNWLHARKFERAAKDPQNIYKQNWKNIEQKLNRSLDIYPQSSNLKDFPVTEYEDYEKYLKDFTSLKENPLTNEAIHSWIMSSGTTQEGNSKVFPKTFSHKKSMQTIVYSFLYYLIRDCPEIFAKKMAYVTAPDCRFESDFGIPIDFSSRNGYKDIPVWLKESKLCIPEWVFKDHKTFNEHAFDFVIAADLSCFFTITPLSFESVMERAESSLPAIIDKIKSDLIKVPKERLEILESLQLNRKTQETKFMAKDLWPNLRALVFWKGASSRPSFERVQGRINSGIALREIPYSATEAWMTIPLDDKIPTVLHCDSHIIEFCPEDQEPTQKNLIKPWDLKPGSRYEVFLTTHAGLVRYRLKDIVQCEGFYHQAPKLRFIRKCQHYLRLSQLSFSEYELSTAISRLDIDTTNRFYFGPNHKGNGLIFWIEGDQASSNQYSNDLQNKIHEELCETSQFYRLYTSNKMMPTVELEQLSIDQIQKIRNRQTAQSKDSSIVNFYLGE